MFLKPMLPCYTPYGAQEGCSCCWTAKEDEAGEVSGDHLRPERGGAMSDYFE